MTQSLSVMGVPENNNGATLTSLFYLHVQYVIYTNVVNFV